MPDRNDSIDPAAEEPAESDYVLQRNEDGSVTAPLPANEAERLAELGTYDVIDTLPEQAYDDITYLASRICETPIALVSLVDEKRQWFKSRVGLDTEETSRDQAFCAHAILEPEELFIVNDASADQRFAENPLVRDDPSIRFYAGAPLVTSSGNALGTLCVIDRAPRDLDDDERESLRALARQVMAQLELRRSLSAMQKAAEERRAYERRLEEYQRKLEEGYAAMRDESVTDALTGIKNRRAFLERLDEEARRAHRSGSALSLILLDVDRFKALNDGYGHQAGDEVLRLVAELLEANSRIHDFVARYGGEEFAVILPDTDFDGAHVLAERYRSAVERADWEHRQVTVSVGVASHIGEDADAYTLFSEADDALYQAKEQGRNRVVCAEAA